MVVMGDADQAVDVQVTRQWVTKMQELGMSDDSIEVPGGSLSVPNAKTSRKCFRSWTHTTSSGPATV